MHGNLGKIRSIKTRKKLSDALIKAHKEGRGRWRLMAIYSVDVKTGCWNVQRNKGTGYYRIAVNGKVFLAHRYFYQLFKGEIPKGLQIDHLCKNRRCCNPDHLEAVTPAENTRRAAKKLSMNKIIEIKKLQGLSQSVIAKRFGVHQSQISRVLNGRRWSERP